MSDPELKAKVEEIIRDNEVLLFMKGVPEAPRCGFSMRVVGMLEQLGAEYGAVDVLPALDPLREATGEISDWRTFPQLYVKGELVGGCDIVEEMFESGELAQLLGVEQPEAASAPEPEKLVPGGPAAEPADAARLGSSTVDIVVAGIAVVAFAATVFVLAGIGGRTRPQQPRTVLLPDDNRRATGPRPLRATSG